MTRISPRTAEDLIEQGLTASRAGSVEQAISLFKEAAAAAPQSGIPPFLLAAELAQSGHTDEAEAAYATAVLLAPELHMARYQLGLVQFTGNRPAIALLTWEPLLHLPAESPLPSVVKGFASLAQDDFAAASAQFKQAIALNHDNDALTKDMQMMLHRIAALGAPAPGPTAANGESTPPEQLKEQVEDGALHVLLTNYQQQGPLH